MKGNKVTTKCKKKNQKEQNNSPPRQVSLDELQQIQGKKNQKKN